MLPICRSVAPLLSGLCSVGVGGKFRRCRVWSGGGVEDKGVMAAYIINNNIDVYNDHLSFFDRVSC